MSYYDHATMIVHRLGPWQPDPEPPFDVPVRYRKRRPKRLAKVGDSPERSGAGTGNSKDSASREIPRNTGWRLLVCRIAALLPLVQSKGLTGSRKA
jgi:hypothetical protein